MSSTTTRNKIGAEDIKWWDGINSTFTRATSTGGLLTLSTVGIEIDVAEAYGAGTISETALRDAINNIGSNSRTITLRSGTWSITEDLTIPANISVRFINGAVLEIASGKTITINGPIEAGRYQIFSGDGSYVFPNQPLFSSWFETLTDAVTYISTNDAVLVITESETISADLTIPSTTALCIPFGNILTVATTKTLTIQGPLEAGNYQLFTLAGSGVVAFGTGYVSNFYPLWWGVTGDGVTDDTAAIQAAIDAAGSAGGGKVILLPGDYLITSGLEIGDAPDGDTGSTYDGVHLIGTAPAYGLYIGCASKSPVNLITDFAAPDWAISINGPIMGWGVKGLSISCTGDSNASGLLVTAAASGECSDILIVNCENTSLALTTYATGSNCTLNTFDRIFIFMPLSAASAVGILLTGDTSGGDSCFNTFRRIHITPTDVGQIGIEFQYCDNNSLYDVDINPCGAYALHYNYNIKSGFPGGNMINGIDPNDNSVAIAGAPPTTGFVNNYIWLLTGNGADPVEIAGVRYETDVHSFSRMYLDSAQSIGGAGAVVLFDATSFDPDSIANLTNSTFGIKVSGYYRVRSQITVASYGGASSTTVLLNKNAATDICKAIASNNGVTVTVPLEATVWLDKNDYIYIHCTISGGSTALTTGTIWTWIEIEGPL